MRPREPRERVIERGPTSRDGGRDAFLAERVVDRGFTPRVADIDAVVTLLADDATARAAERAIVRAHASALAPLLVRLESASVPVRSRIVRVIGRIAARDESTRAVAVLIRALGDRDPKTRRNAAIALGHIRSDGVEDALLGAWDRDRRPEMKRSLASSLGKVGTARSLAVLRGAANADDGELARIAGRAVAIIERTASRGSSGHVAQIAPAMAPPRPIDTVLLCRFGLEELLREELEAIPAVGEARVGGPGQVFARLSGPMQALFSSRTMLSLRFPLPAQRLDRGEGVEGAVARALAGDAAKAIFDTWAVGAPRYRIAWQDGRHRRAATWETARVVGREVPGLVNDPTDCGWQVVVAAHPPLVEVAIAPRRLADPRFSWRVRDVPAASHPTIAAALARVGGVRQDDVVWDPFVGSGAELIERARLGPYRRLIGSDADERALAAARDNIAAAGIQASLEQADVFRLNVDGATLILTNPPMGRRVSRASGLADILDRFVAHAAAALRPEGRLVWIAPWPQRARRAGARAGLDLRWARMVDMGGFEGELQRWQRPA